MKTNQFLAAALIAAMGLSACSQNEDVTDSKNDVVNITASITGGGNAAPQSRATIEPSGQGTFDNGDVWGMYATVGGSPVLANDEYTVGATTYNWSNLSETDPVTFAAYYPCVANVDDPAAYLFNAATNVMPDLLVATPVTKSKGEDVRMAFKHVMNRLVIGSLSKDASLPGNVEDAEVTLLNMKSTAKVNLLTGAVDLAAASGSDAYPSKTGASAWLVAPQNIAEGADWVQLELEGKTYIYKVPAASVLASLESGKRVILNLTLKPGGAVVGDVTIDSEINGWGNQGSITGDADEQ